MKAFDIGDDPTSIDASLLQVSSYPQIFRTPAHDTLEHQHGLALRFYPTTKEVAQVVATINRKLFKENLLKSPETCRKEAIYTKATSTQQFIAYNNIICVPEARITTTQFE